MRSSQVVGVFLRGCGFALESAANIAKTFGIAVEEIFKVPD